MRHLHHVIALVAISMVFQSAANAQQCTAHYKFDGNISDSSSAGLSAFLADAAKAASSVQFAEGKHSQALVLDGNTVLRMPIDLSFESCPQFTMTMWLKAPAPLGKGPMYIVASGAGNTPGISVSGTTVTASGSANGISKKGALYGGPEWVFVAVVYDSIEETFRLHLQQRNYPKTLGSIATAAESIWFGAFDQKGRYASNGLLVDDFRIYPQALTVENVEDIRKGTASAPGTQADFASSAGSEGGACSAHEQCGTGFYCALDGTCHPDGHAPMQSFEIVELETQGTAGIMLPTLPAESGGSNDQESADQISYPRPTGSEQLTTITGSSGDIVRRLDLQDRFMTGISWSETGDRPCHIDISSRSFKDKKIDMVFGQNCDYRSLNRKNELTYDDRYGVNLQEPEFTDFSTQSAIGRLQVCNNSNNNRRMKGLRIWGDWIAPDGTTTYIPNSDEYELTNCSTWAPPVQCGSGQAATGIVIHATRATGDRQQITGLQLICREIGLN